MIWPINEDILDAFVARWTVHLDETHGPKEIWLYWGYWARNCSDDLLDKVEDDRFRQRVLGSMSQGMEEDAAYDEARAYRDGSDDIGDTSMDPNNFLIRYELLQMTGSLPTGTDTDMDCYGMRCFLRKTDKGWKALPGRSHATENFQLFGFEGAQRNKTVAFIDEEALSLKAAEEDRILTDKAETHGRGSYKYTRPSLYV